VAIALKVEAGRVLIAAPAPELRTRGEAMLRRAGDPGRERAGGVGAGGRRCHARPRAPRWWSNELAAAEADAPAEAVRALRFPPGAPLRGGRPLRGGAGRADAAASDGDPLARAWSYELARRSGEAILEVAILSEETRASDDVLGDELRLASRTARRWLRAGDPSGAAAAFRRALAAAGHGADRGRRGAGAGSHRRADPAGSARRWRTRCGAVGRRAPTIRRWPRRARARRRCCGRPP
jgi:hypothetical protein